MTGSARRLWRGLLLRQLARTTPQRLRLMGERRLIAAFRRASTGSRAYARLLAEHGATGSVKSVDDFVARAPLLDKQSTFGRFSLEELCLPGTMQRLAGVLTSSGHGGTFGFGLSTWSQARQAPDLIDLGLQQTFDTDGRKTLVINCLPMGVRFQSRAVAVADVSVREDMALALLDRFGPHFEQVVLVTDPLFGKRLLDFADEQGTDWRRHRIHVVIGEEMFGERFRDYVATKLGIDVDDPDGGFIASSMGVGELGLNLFFETRETVAMRRLLDSDDGLRRALLGEGPFVTPPPVLFAYNPLRTFVEVVDPDPQGFGQLAVSIVDADNPLPLLRYRTGDIARLLGDADVSRLRAALPDRHSARAPFPLLAIAGRDKDILPNRRSVLGYKDALYRDSALAALLTGAMRLEWTDAKPHAHVQLRRGQEPHAGIESALSRILCLDGSELGVTCWRFPEFPFGMNLDYERKFTYFSQK